jgi:hypothetical protein
MFKDAFGEEIVEGDRVLYAATGHPGNIPYHIGKIVKLVPAIGTRPDRVSLWISTSSCPTDFSRSPLLNACNVVKLNAIKPKGKK